MEDGDWMSWLMAQDPNTIVGSKGEVREIPDLQSLLRKNRWLHCRIYHAILELRLERGRIGCWVVHVDMQGTEWRIGRRDRACSRWASSSPTADRASWSVPSEKS